MNPTIATMASRPAQISMSKFRDKDLANVTCKFDLIPKQAKMKIAMHLGEVIFQPLHMDGKSKPNSTTYYNWTPVFEWCLVKCGSKNGHQKMCLYKIGSCAQNLLTSLRLTV
jgi:hypothetical protein